MAKNKIIAAGNRPVISMSAPVAIKAAEGDDKGAPKFDVTAYTGGALSIAGWDYPVVIDLNGLQSSRSVVANLYHDDERPVGHVTARKTTETELQLEGVFSIEGADSELILKASKNKFPWEASVEVMPSAVEEVESGQTATVNGQEFTGPVSITRSGTLSGFAFVLHGADPNTDVKIAATKAASTKENHMEPKLQEFIEAMLPGVDASTLPAEAVANLKADMDGKAGERHKVTATAPTDAIEKRRIEAQRRSEIKSLAEEACDQALELERYEAIDEIRTARDAAIKGGLSVSDFKYELKLATLMEAPPRIHSGSDKKVSEKVLAAAVCQAGALPENDKKTGKAYFDDQTLQIAHDLFKGRISFRGLYAEAAQANGYQGRIPADVDTEVHNAAMGMLRGPQIKAAHGWTTISLPNVFTNVSNLFLRQGWLAVDDTPLRLAATRSVRNFQQITTVSLTGGALFEELGKGGEIPHGKLGEEVYNNQAKTRGLMFAITREDIINDDLGALTAIPRRMGRSGMLTLNHVFWTVFLNNGSFFASGNNNVNTGVATMTVAGLAATEEIFAAQTDPDGLPMLSQPAILLVPPALLHAAKTLMSSDFLIDGTGTAVQGSANVFRGRFRVESSQFMANSAYTGFDADGWYLLADPNDIPVVEIVALNGRIEPTVETAEASFNTLGVLMRGFNDIGVALQEFRGGVRADGGSS